MELKSLRTKVATDGPMSYRRRKGQSVECMGLWGLHRIQKEVSGHVSRGTGTEVYLNLTGVAEGGGQDPLRYRNHPRGECPATEVGHSGLTSCSPAFKLCNFR